jgi:sugar phosphate isomerase/epimerase
MRQPLLNRRSFLIAGAASAMSGAAQAAPFFAGSRRIGIQLYTLGPDAAKDLDGTLGALAKIGYREIELPGFMGRKAADLKAALSAHGLTCPSIHVQARGGFDGDLAKLADELATLGAKSAVMPSPFVPDRILEAAKGLTGGDMYRKVMSALTADDYKANAQMLNAKAEVLKRSGIAVGYHNHNFELAPQGTTTGLDILIAQTDPKLVSFQADVGWIAAAGVDPLAYIQKHRGRFSAMHVKDIKATTQPNFELRMDPTEVGSGRIDWKRLLPAAAAAGVKGFYVEQEAPFERPRIEAAKISYDFLAKVGA